MKSILTFVIAGAAILASPAMTLAAPIPIAKPFPVMKVDRGMIQINAVTESRMHRHFRMKHVATRSRPHSMADSFASSSYNGMHRAALPTVRPVNPGDPGNPYLNDSFDRSVERHAYNGS